MKQTSLKFIMFMLLIMAASLVTPLSAQKHKGGNRAAVEKELREFKLKFLAQEMDLKEDQQAKFAEVYTRMTDEKRNVYKTAADLERKVKKDKNATEADYTKATEAMAQAKIEEGKIDKKYEAEFKSFLSAKQIYKMKQGEEKFRKKLKELKNKKK